MYGYGGWGWIPFMPLLWIALVVIAVWAVIRLTRGPSGGARGHGRGRGQEWTGGGPGSPESPEEIVDRRYASGEIDTDTYTEMREYLAAHRPKPR
ncbi:SHOCT domain-containing protein [Streptomyces collinus]|uniref:SHOCT domain-containing protein n=1 Tax=Streptomyces collinus TaxID=42684 RepID=UPI00331FD0CC